jgi:hypothetical protein
MPDYHRNRVPGGTYFLTVNLRDRRSDLLVTQIDILRDAVRRARLRAPLPYRRRVATPLSNPRSPLWAQKSKTLVGRLLMQRSRISISDIMSK